MKIFYNSQKEEFKKPFGCIKEGQNCTISISIEKGYFIEKVFLVMKDEENEFSHRLEYMGESSGLQKFCTTFSIDKKGTYFYYFTIEYGGNTLLAFKGDADITSPDSKNKWQLTCYDKDFVTPDWFKGKVMYQIFPDRFFAFSKTDTKEKLTPYYIHENKSDCPAYLPDENGRILNNDFFGGNFLGIEKKLPYIKSLGVSVIYLNPVFMAYSNHRYDTCDYKRTDPLLGTKEDFKRLCEKAHSMDIKIILDGVFSHTGSNSIYFDKEKIFGTGACAEISSPYFSWYTFYEYPNSYEAWWGIDTLPCVKEMEKSYLDYIIRDEDSVIKHWLRLGADGFRLDVADELPDEFISLLRHEMKKEKADALLIGEVWEDASNKVAYGNLRKYFSHGELDSVMNYPFMNLIIAYVKGRISGKDFSIGVMTIAENYPKEVLPCLMNSLSTHDTARIMTVLSDCPMDMPKEQKAKYVLKDNEKQKSEERIFLAVFLQFVLPGCPCIYYGDELGMEGFEDPFNRRYFQWEKENEPLKNFYKTISHIKNENPALQKGIIDMISEENRLVIVREIKEEKIFAVINESEKILFENCKSPLFLHAGTPVSDGVFLQKGGFVIYRK